MMAEYELAPWGEVAGDFRAGTIGMGIAKAALGNAVDGKDFMVDFSDKKQTPEQMKAILRGFAARKASP